MNSISVSEEVELRRIVASAMIHSERFLEALMQEAPLGAPVSDSQKTVERTRSDY